MTSSSIPRSIRSTAAEAYRHHMYTGRDLFMVDYQAYRSGDNMIVEHMPSGENWTVPIAASWI